MLVYGGLQIKKLYLRKFIQNKHAVSEEFTSLPALSVIMIGFALFFVLLASAYTSYDLRVESLEKYQTANFIATKLTNPECFFIQEGGLVNLPLLLSNSGEEQLEEIRQEYQSSKIHFVVQLSWDKDTKILPADQLSGVGNRVAVSKNVGIYLNEAQTVPGTLTIILWSA